MKRLTIINDSFERLWGVDDEFGTCEREKEEKQKDISGFHV